MQVFEHRQEAGLQADLERLLRSAADRRTSLRWLLAGAAALPVAGCGGSGGLAVSNTALASSTTGGSTGGSSGGAAGGTSGGTTTGNLGCAAIPEETAGPYPADGTNSSVGGIANALALSGIVRSDIRASIPGASGVAAGIPLTLRLQLVNVGASCGPLTGVAVYLWHCDRAGNYSMYSSGVTGENYLRGVQAADSNGVVSFTTIFPGCYAGRMPHMHFEVYPSVAAATSAANRIKTSQLTFPMATLNDAYGVSGYETSARNLAGISYATDNVFNDGTSLQMASVTGSAAEGYVATLSVGVHL
jgi:protocatechuate 3,4-dioxygenase beta subunit